MNKVFYCDPVIFPCKIWITIGASTEYLNSLFEELIESIPQNLCATTTCNYYKGEKGILIRFKDEDSVNFKVVAHESAHAALKLFQSIGSSVTSDSDEIFAHLIGHIAECVCHVKAGKITTTLD